MKIIFTLCTLFALAATAHAKLYGCNDEFRKLEQQTGLKHTMCKYTPWWIGRVDDSDKKFIIERHNKLRANAYPGFPARAMCKVYWDKNIARIAEYHASTCPTGHDELRDVPGYNIAIEQNLALGAGNWHSAIQSWFDTKRFFRHENHRWPYTFLPPSGDHRPYSRMVHETMCRMGCGFAWCGSKKTYVCNYASGDIKYKYPFKSGSACQDCPSKCVRKLCDCQGKVCYNGGTLNPNTCTCTCLPSYKGGTCNRIKCPKNDPSTCPTDSLLCRNYGYTHKCPHLCKTCENFIKPPKAKLIIFDK